MSAALSDVAQSAGVWKALPKTGWGMRMEEGEEGALKRNVEMTPIASKWQNKSEDLAGEPLPLLLSKSYSGQVSHYY